MKTVLNRVILSGLFMLASHSLEAMEEKEDKEHGKIEGKDRYYRIFKDARSQLWADYSKPLAPFPDKAGFEDKLRLKLLEAHGAVEGDSKTLFSIVTAVMAEHMALDEHLSEERGQLKGMADGLLKEACDHSEPYAPALIYYIRVQCDEKNLVHNYESYCHDYEVTIDNILILLPRYDDHGSISKILQALRPYADKLSEDELCQLPRYFIMASYGAFKRGEYGFGIDAMKARRYAAALKGNKDPIGQREQEMKAREDRIIARIEELLKQSTPSARGLTASEVVARFQQETEARRAAEARRAVDASDEES